jgi:hypothetical protein
MTSDAPAMRAAYGRPQALAWNIGTTGRTRSALDSAKALPVHAAIEWRKAVRWE